jgi:hypothetical protein
MQWDGRTLLALLEVGSTMHAADVDPALAHRVRDRISKHRRRTPILNCC